MITIVPMMTSQVSIAPSCIEDYLKGNKIIKDSACRIEGDTAVVAILSAPIFTKSDKDKLLANTAEDIAKNFNLSRVIVTLDSEVFCRIQLDNANVAKLMALLTGRGGYYEYSDYN